MVWNFLRLRQRPPGKPPPPGDRVDVFYDDATGKISAEDFRGAAVLFDAVGGAVSTADLTTSSGLAAAAAGKLGEVKEDTSGAAALTDGVALEVANVVLTPGQWVIYGKVDFTADAADVTAVRSSIGSAPPPDNSTTHLPWVLSAGSGSATAVVSPRFVRFDAGVASSITFRLYAVADFSSGNVEVEYAEIQAIRVA